MLWLSFCSDEMHGCVSQSQNLTISHCFSLFLWYLTELHTHTHTHTQAHEMREREREMMRTDRHRNSERISKEERERRERVKTLSF